MPGSEAWPAGEYSLSHRSTSPDVSHAGVGLDDPESIPPLQVVAGGKAGLAPPDDEDVGMDRGRVGCGGHRSVLARRSFVGRRRPEHRSPRARLGVRAVLRIRGSTQSIRRQEWVLRRGRARMPRPWRPPRRHVELRVQVAHVPVDGPLADPELVGDVAIGPPAGEMVQHLELARTETVAGAAGAAVQICQRRRRTKRFEDAASRRRSRARRSRCRRARGRRARSRRGRVHVIAAHRAPATVRTRCAALEAPRAVCLRRAGPLPRRAR